MIFLSVKHWVPLTTPREQAKPVAVIPISVSSRTMRPPSLPARFSVSAFRRTGGTRVCASE